MQNASQQAYTWPCIEKCEQTVKNLADLQTLKD